MYFLAIALGLALGLCRGGRLHRLLEADLRAVPWLLGAAGLRLALYVAAAQGVALAAGSALALAASLVCLAVFAWANRHLAAVLPAALGFLLNFLAMAANGGRMPVSAQAAARAGLDATTLAAHGDNVHVLASASPRLAWLTDVLYLPPPFPMPIVFSVGDLFVCLGLAWLVYELLGAGRPALAPRTGS